LKHFALYLALLGGFASTAPAQEPQTAAMPGGRVVLVLPFENRSGNPSLGWIGDSFPDTLNKRLNTVGFLTISRDDRAFALDHLGLPAGFRPSRASTIRIAQQLDANYVIVGSYTVKPAGTTSANETAKAGTGIAGSYERISIQAQVLSVDALTLSRPVADGAELYRLFDAENAIAWKVAREIDPKLQVAEMTFLAAPGTVPLPAFEDYIRGANATSPDERLKRLQSAVGIAPEYAAALLALGKEQYAARDYAAAAATLTRVPRTDRLALEANFYVGLAQFNSAHYAAAQKAFNFVEAKLPLPEVINDEAVAMSRQGKDGVVLFRRASVDDPSEEDYHYNLAIALFREGLIDQALKETETALKLKPGDNEAVELRKQLKLAPTGSRLDPNAASGFSPVERIRRNYSETSFRQAAFQLDQLRDARLALLPPGPRAVQYCQIGRDYLAQGLLPEAESQFQSAMDTDPNSAEAHAGLAQVREYSGDPQRARLEAAASLKLHANVSAWMVLARLDLAANQLPACADDVAHALLIEPANYAALAMRQALQQRGQTLP
jgi:tetratricopeptide (TPR) repeat protein/TolB-like protein